jgi:TatA/E family protein of Tat protein translocase
MIGTWESLVILVAVVLLVVWVGKKSPEMARNAGKSIREFKDGMKELPKAVEEIKQELKE